MRRSTSGAVAGWRSRRPQAEGPRSFLLRVGVGGEGFLWSGVASVHIKQEWPDWYPPAEMLQRKPELRPAMTELQSGLGMVGGPENPLGARTLYLWQGKKDTLYRIHGTNEPWTIGHNVSSGCIRLTNEDVIDLYDHTPVGTKVVVLPSPTAQSLLNTTQVVGALQDIRQCERHVCLSYRRIISARPPGADIDRPARYVCSVPEDQTVRAERRPDSDGE
jgi:hypothetical protein